LKTTNVYKMPLKGKTNNPKGRPKGVPNKVTTEIRSALKDLADNNLEKVQGWLDSIAEEDPKGALGMYLQLLEYVQPKLSRTELAGDKENPLGIGIDMSKWK
jgi:hypothetical protein